MVDEKIEEKEAVGMRCCMDWKVEEKGAVGMRYCGWVGGWVGRRRRRRRTYQPCGCTD